MQIKWLGNASFMIKSLNTTIYLDPYGGSESDYEEKADIILISHEHFDHCDRNKIKLIRTDNTQIFTTGDIVSNLNAVDMKPGDEKELRDVTIKAVEAYNINKNFHPKGSAIGFLIKVETKTIYFAGDTDLIPEMDNIKTDIALLPVGGTYVMNPKEAASAALKIKPRIVIPMHYGSASGTIEDAEYFKEIVEIESTEIRVDILQEGSSIDL